MGEIWAAAAVTVVGGVIAGKGAEKKDKKDKAFQEAMTKEESALAAQRTGYEMALEEFYTQRQRQRTQRGLDQFRQFSTMHEFAPGYDINSEARIDPGEAPDYNAFAPSAPTQEQAEAGAGKSGGGSTFKKIQKKVRDPLGLF